MAVLNALHPAAAGLRRNPSILAVTGLYGVVQLLQLLAQGRAPRLAVAASLAVSAAMLFVFPFVQGGLIAMAGEALEGRSSVSRLFSAGRANYAELLVSYFALFAVNVALGMVLLFGLFVGGAGALFGDGSLSTGTLVALAAFGAAVGLAYLLVSFLVQFYGHAIVLEGAGVVEGFTRSALLVRGNVLAVAGYLAVLLVGGAAVGLLAAVGSAVLVGDEFLRIATPPYPTGAAALAAVGLVVGTALAGGFYATYSVAFFRALTGDRPPD